MNKIDLNLSDADLLLLMQVVGASGSPTLVAEVTKATNLINEADYILHRVCNILANMSGKPVAVIENMAAGALNQQSLRYNVGITSYQQQALKSPFMSIVQALHYTGIITVAECSALATITDCITLIQKKK